MSNGPTKTLLHSLNSAILILGLAIFATSAWFFAQVFELTSLRNSNHYMLDYNLYWPQAIPWMFLITSVLVICVSGCGFAGANKGSKRVLKVYIVCSSLVIVILIGAAIVALVFADNKATDDFLKDTVWDVYFHAKTDREVENKFGLIERKLHCCGAENPRDYVNWKDRFPVSCCDTYYHAWGFENQFIDCDFTNKLANERHGCSTVAVQYARIVIKVLSGAAIFVAFLKIVALIVAVSISKSMKTKTRVLAAQHESESKKVLL